MAIDGFAYLRDHRLARVLITVEFLESWPHGVALGEEDNVLSLGTAHPPMGGRLHAQVYAAAQTT
jgi:hypothetical protein